MGLTIHTAAAKFPVTLLPGQTGKPVDSPENGFFVLAQ